jgi:hypothetical protein
VPAPKIAIRVVEDTHTFEGDDGDIIWCGGYAPISDEGTFLSVSEHLTSDPRAFYCRVAGAKYRPAALADKRFAHGSQIVLRAEPDNEHDENAVGIWDASRKLHVGYVPATLSAEVAALMRAGTALGGQVIREFRAGSARGKRIAIHVILAPVGPVIFAIEDE